jgi:hypothetical protein
MQRRDLSKALLLSAATPALLATSTAQAQSITAAESLAGVTPTDDSFPPGDIRRYGAVSGQDSTAAIAAAIAQMNAGGDQVFVPVGVFWSSTSHTVTYTGWRVVGEDGVRSIIRFTGSGVGLVISGLFGYMRGVGLYNGGSCTHGLVLHNAGGSSFYNVFAGGGTTGFASHGVRIDESYTTPTGNNNNMRFINCYSSGNAGCGFAIPATGSDQNAIEFIACNASVNGSHGMLLKGQANRGTGGIFEGNGGYGIQISEASDSASSTRSVIHYPYLESNTLGGVRGGGKSHANVLYLDGLNANSSYTRAASSEDFWIQPSNTFGPFLQMGDPACYVKLHAVTTGTPRVGVSADGSTANLTLYINGKGTGGTWLEAVNDSSAGLVRIGQQGSGIRDVIHGQTTFGGGSSVPASLGVTLPANTYKVMISANANKTFWVTNKTATGFTLNANSASGDTVDWMVVL